MTTTIARARPAPELDENPRAVIGSNRPPIEEQGVTDFNEAIDGHEGLRKRILSLCDSATRATATDDETSARCAELVRQMGAAEKVVDAERENVKRPYLTAGRRIDDAAKTLIAQLATAKGTVRGMAEGYLRDKARREESTRQEALRIEREEAAARQRKIDEANRIAAQKAEAERKRLQAIEDEKAAAEAREAAQVVVEPEPVFIAPELERAPIAEAAPVQIRSDFGAVASTRKVKVATITDWNKAFKRVSKMPAVQEAVQKAVNGLVRAGEVNIPGVEITDDFGISIR
jgi:hypothetical protein